MSDFSDEVGSSILSIKGVRVSQARVTSLVSGALGRGAIFEQANDGDVTGVVEIREAIDNLAGESKGQNQDEGSKNLIESSSTYSSDGLIRGELV